MTNIETHIQKSAIGGWQKALGMIAIPKSAIWLALMSLGIPALAGSAGGYLGEGLSAPGETDYSRLRKKHLKSLYEIETLRANQRINHMMRQLKGERIT